MAERAAPDGSASHLSHLPTADPVNPMARPNASLDSNPASLMARSRWARRRAGPHKAHHPCSVVKIASNRSSMSMSSTRAMRLNSQR